MPRTNKATRNQRGVVGEAEATLKELEELLAAGLADGSVVKDSVGHNEVKREIRKLRDAMNLSRRRCPP